MGVLHPIMPNIGTSSHTFIGQYLYVAMAWGYFYCVHVHNKLLHDLPWIPKSLFKVSSPYLTRFLRYACQNEKH